MAGRIPQDFIDQLLSRIDLVEVIDKRVPLRKAGREYNACCPFHTEKTPSFTVSPHKQFYHCFGCGAHGTAIAFLMDYEHLGFLDSVEELARSVGLELPRGIDRDQDDHSNLFDLLEQAERFFCYQLRTHPTRAKAVDYLRNRGLSGEIVKTFGIGYAPPGWDALFKALSAKGITAKDMVTAGLIVETDNGGHHDRFRDRIMFPIRDRRGRPIAFGARALGEAMPKYLNSPETPFFHKGRELYGLYEARMSQRRLQQLLVVEGYMDVVALAQHDIPYTVATLGTATTAEHLERLFRITRDVVFCFDGDRAGRQAAWRALENALPLMRDGRQAGFLFLPEGEDPDSLVRKEDRAAFEQRLSQAVPLSNYFFERLKVQVDMDSLDGRARFVELARPLVDRMPDSVFRDLIIQGIEERAGVAGIKKRLKTTAPSGPRSAPRQLNVKRTPVRLAIALLLHQPQLAQRAGDMARFRGIPIPGMNLLIGLVELLQTHPHITAAAPILERYRDTETGDILERLTEWRPEIPQHLFAAEFSGILKKLEIRYSLENRLLDKLAQGQLSEEEREVLRNLGKTSSV